MNKQVSNISYKDFYRDFLHDKISISICCLTLLLLITSYFVFFQKEPLQIYPNNENVQIIFYTDSVDNGNSIVESFNISDSLISMDFILKEGFVRPYIGIGLILPEKEEIDISGYNQVQIEVQGKGINNIEVYLISNDSSDIKNLGRFPIPYYRESINLTSGEKLFKLSINNFHVPDWWFDINNLSPIESKAPNWKKRLARINFSTGLTPTLNKKKILNISSVSFTRNNSRTIIYMFIIQVGILLLVFIFRNTSFRKILPITIKYKAVIIDDKIISDNSFLDYISNNFPDNELTLKKVARNTGIKPRIITDTIVHNFGCNFKTYINQIRISESRRLLRETDLRISEIAYKVGFNSPNHFNRVFKKTIGKNPSEFIERH